MALEQVHEIIFQKAICTANGLLVSHTRAGSIPAYSGSLAFCARSIKSALRFL